MLVLFKTDTFLVFFVPFFVYFVVKCSNHKGHKGCTKDTSLFASIAIGILLVFLVPFFVYFVVKCSNHKGHKGCTKDTKQQAFL